MSPIFLIFFCTDGVQITRLLLISSHSQFSGELLLILQVQLAPSFGSLLLSHPGFVRVPRADAPCPLLRRLQKTRTEVRVRPTLTRLLFLDTFLQYPYSSPVEHPGGTPTCEDMTPTVPHQHSFVLRQRVRSRSGGLNPATKSLKAHVS